MEGPFAVELQDGRDVFGVAVEAVVGYDVLAGVVAFGGTVPEEQPSLKSWMGL